MNNLRLLYIGSALAGMILAFAVVFLAWGIVEAQTVQVSNHDSVFPTPTPQPSPQLWMSAKEAEAFRFNPATSSFTPMNFWLSGRQLFTVDSRMRVVSTFEPIVTKEGGKWVVSFKP